MIFRTAVWAFVAYWIGTLPSPWIIAKLARRGDVIAEMQRRDSPGDAHFLVTKRMSGRLGALAVVADIVKGFAPALAARLAHQPAGTTAWVGVAALGGHCFAPFLRRVGGRGLTTAAGVAFALIPKAMIGGGLISAVGMAAKAGGLGTSIGFGLLPVFTVAFGYSHALVAMSVGLVALIALRRLEGFGDDHRSGVSAGRILVSRLLFDLPRGQHSSRSPEGTAS